MKNISLKKIALFCTMFLIAGFSASELAAQTVYQTQVMDIRLQGTSNLHDWEMKAIKGESEASFTVDSKNKITSLNKLSFTLPAKNLKSKHNQMDKNTYKALNTDKNPNISFVLSSATVTPTGDNNYKLNCIGKLTIAGITKQTELLATGKFNPADKTFTVSGSEKMKMTDYKVAPPKAMLGTITTGNDITILYNLKFKK